MFKHLLYIYTRFVYIICVINRYCKRNLSMIYIYIYSSQSIRSIRHEQTAAGI
mgnify:CR=1 FL=1